jgi:hypothetical protein
MLDPIDSSEVIAELRRTGAILDMLTFDHPHLRKGHETRTRLPRWRRGRGLTRRRWVWDETAAEHEARVGALPPTFTYRRVGR